MVFISLLQARLKHSLMGINFSRLLGGHTAPLSERLRVAIDVDFTDSAAVQRAHQAIQQEFESSVDPTFFLDDAYLSRLAMLARYMHADKTGASTECIEEEREALITMLAEQLSPMGEEAVLHTLETHAVENVFSLLLSKPDRLCLAARVWCARGDANDLWDAIDQAVIDPAVIEQAESSGSSPRKIALSLEQIETRRCEQVRAYTQAAQLYTQAAAIYKQKGRDRDALDAYQTVGKTYLFLAGTHWGTDYFDFAADAFLKADSFFRKAKVPEQADDAKRRAHLALDKALAALRKALTDIQEA